jgi:hypothetical protein
MAGAAPRMSRQSQWTGGEDWKGHADWKGYAVHHWFEPASDGKETRLIPYLSRPVVNLPSTRRRLRT